MAVTTMVDDYKWGNDTTPSVQPLCGNKYWSSPWQAVTAPGDITYPDVQIKDMGTYGFVETLKVTVNGTDTVLHTGKCGAEGETVVATEQAVTVTPAAAALAPAPAAPAGGAPIADTGYQAPAADGNAFLPLEIGGGILLAGLIVLAGALVQRNRAHRKDEALAGAQGTGTDSLQG